MEINVGQQVIVRWSDGLRYYGQVTKIDHKAQRYSVAFGPENSYLVLFKDTKEISGDEDLAHAQEHDLLCEACNSGASHKPNEIVICDKCGRGYHQRCHKPRIDPRVLMPDIDWICWKCTHGEVQSDNTGSGRKSSIRTLPYSLSLLTWNAEHTANDQEMYCYCGGPGEWYNKMVQCAGCNQWFHQACLSCLGEPPLLYGDRFYYFLCSICNAGAEYIQRLQFDLRYMDFDEELFPLFDQHGAYLGLEKLTENKRGELWRTLEEHRNRFASAREVKKKKGLWCLRGAIAPPIPISFPARPAKGAKASLHVKKGVVLPLSLQSPIRGAPPTAGYGIKHNMIRSGLSKPRTPSPSKRPLHSSHPLNAAKKSKTVRCMYPADGEPPFHDFQQLKLYVQRMRGGSASTGGSAGAVALIANGAKYRVLARRVTADTREEYLIHWL